MNLLFRVIHASRCTSTHHKLAVDALRHLQGSFAEPWQNLFLKHIQVYLDGAKAPDTRFKDFRNHVLHVAEGHWGGAATTARKWYELTVQGLRSHNWVQAVYAAGVLSHYYVDPIQPFHTGQSEQENNIHRAAEWSINKSYDDLFRLVAERQGFPQVDVPTGDDWLEQMVAAGAELSHAHYESLIEHYHFDQGVQHPPSGLDATSREFLAQLLGYAQVGVARILDRAIAQARVSPPVTFVTVRTVLATVQVPVRWVTQKIANVHERLEIEAIYRELKTTGKVERLLPADDRAVRELHAVEVLARPQKPAAESSRLAPGRPPEGPVSAASPFTAGSNSPRSGERTPSSPAAHDKPPTSPGGRTRSGERIPSSSAAGAPKSGLNDEFEAPARTPKTRDDLPHRPYLKYPTAEAGPAAAPADRRRGEAQRFDEPQAPLRFHLELTSAVADAPSIGPKTARQLQKVRVRTVADLLRLNPEQASAKIGTRHITPQVVRDWQDQARLVCRIPQLRGHDAQILVACGYTEPEQLAGARDQEVLARVQPFCTTSEGQRVLRSSSPPDLAEIGDWIRWAQTARRLEAA